MDLYSLRSLHIANITFLFSMVRDRSGALYQSVPLTYTRLQIASLIPVSLCDYDIFVRCVHRHQECVTAVSTGQEGLIM